MEVYGLYIPDKPLSNFELIKYAKELNIAHFRGVYMRDELQKKNMEKSAELSTSTKVQSQGHIG